MLIIIIIIIIIISKYSLSLSSFQLPEPFEYGDVICHANMFVFPETICTNSTRKWLNSFQFDRVTIIFKLSFYRDYRITAYANTLEISIEFK